MGGRGPASKDPAKRRRRNATDPEIVLTTDDELRGPELLAGVGAPQVPWRERFRLAGVS